MKLSTLYYAYLQKSKYYFWTILETFVKHDNGATRMVMTWNARIVKFVIYNNDLNQRKDVSQKNYLKSLLIGSID